jgi:hypothetical protein
VGGFSIGKWGFFADLFVALKADDLHGRCLPFRLAKSLAAIAFEKFSVLILVAIWSQNMRKPVIRMIPRIRTKTCPVIFLLTN